jgi:hypothetical protein
MRPVDRRPQQLDGAAQDHMGGWLDGEGSASRIQVWRTKDGSYSWQLRVSVAVSTLEGFQDAIRILAAADGDLQAEFGGQK